MCCQPRKKKAFKKALKAFRITLKSQYVYNDLALYALHSKPTHKRLFDEVFDEFGNIKYVSTMMIEFKKKTYDREENKKSSCG